MSIIKKLSIEFFLTCTFLFGMFSTSVGQSLTAEEYLLKGNFKLAALEYEREYFNAQNNYDRYAAILSKTECYKKSNDFENAFSTIDRISLIGLSDSLRFIVLYQKALCSYLSNRYAQAESYIQQIKQCNYFQKWETSVEINLLYTLVLNELQRWNDAKMMILEVKDSLALNKVEFEGVEKIIYSYSNDSLPKLKNEKVLFWVSFIPGAGIVYAGKPAEGFLNLTINMASLAFGAHQIYYSYYLTGYFGGAIMLQKFYFGGRKRAEFLLNKNNYEKALYFNENRKKEIIEVLQKKNKGA
ncbi:MAG TPA: hypothetical protein PL017_00485 [Tenuifilaceae bacterium]|nr:hypothetical protein [Tenuifilaceae bacterium]HPQ33080.1 hypothetical protein [Tenuifilaceae bacterium]